MATFREIYRDLKNGYEFYQEGVGVLKGVHTSYMFIGTCDRWNSPSYGKDYIYWQNAGQSANKVTFEDMKWVIKEIFGCPTANEFLKQFKKD